MIVLLDLYVNFELGRVKSWICYEMAVAEEKRRVVGVIAIIYYFHKQ